MNILITGVAGFIGMHLAIKFLENDFNVYGIDN
jgi:nucleoside-diphosphate-sugar epimerase